MALLQTAEDTAPIELRNDAFAGKLSACSRDLRQFVDARRTWLWERAPEVLAKTAHLLAEKDSCHEAAGLSREMIREALRNFAATVTTDGLKWLRDSQLRSSGGTYALPPSVVLHLLAGNLFISGFESMMLAGLCGSGSIVRCSSRDLMFPFLWLEALREIDPEFARSVVITHWPTTERDLGIQASECADVVVAFGDDRTISSVRALVPPPVRFIGHGSRVSFAVVTAEALRRNVDGVAKRLAYDFSVYDQQGCLSPRALFVESCEGSLLAALAASISDEMGVLSCSLPRHTLLLEESAALSRAADEAALEAVLSGEARVTPAGDLRFLVTLRAAGSFRLGALNRHVDIRVYASTEELRALLLPYRGRIGCIGSAVTEGEYMHFFEELRAPRVCALGEMQKPPLGWTHDGRQSLAELVDFVSVEPAEGCCPPYRR